MRISELSATTDVPIPTIKYYLREGLLPPGRSTAPNQADYGDRHARRLRLVRVLREVGGLSIEAIRAVVRAIEDRRLSRHEVLGVAHRAVAPATSRDLPAELDEVDAFLDELGWEVSADAPGRSQLAEALASLRDVGRDVDVATFLPHARAVDPLAAFEVGTIAETAPPDEAVEAVVVGTVVYGAALAALRRLAQEHHSAQRAQRTSSAHPGPEA